MSIAVNAYRAVEIIGLPEGRIPLANAVVYVANAPKSNKVCLAIDKALVEREAILANLKEKATKPKSKTSEMTTQKATANPNRPMPKGW